MNEDTTITTATTAPATQPCAGKHHHTQLGPDSEAQTEDQTEALQATEVEWVRSCTPSLGLVLGWSLGFSSHTGKVNGSQEPRGS